MESRRSQLGKRIQKERKAAGYRSARAFAAALSERYDKISERSVAGAEAGEERTGEGTYGMIEKFLGWPHRSIARFLETGDESAFERDQTPPRRKFNNPPLRKSVLEMDRAELVAAAELVAEVRGEEAADDWLRGALEMQADHRNQLRERYAQTFEASVPDAD